jgi:hypothetical protein
MVSRGLMQIAVLAMAAVGSGCSTHTLHLQYEPTGRMEAVTETTPRIAVGSFRDDRGEDSTWFGAIRGGYGNPLKRLHADQPIDAVVVQAVRDALQKRDMLASEGSSSIRIEGAITKLDCNYYWNRDAHAHLLVSLVDIGSNSILFSQTYKTDNVESGVGAGIFGSVEHLALFTQKTLSQTIDKALSDPALLTAVNGRVGKHVAPSADRLAELDELRRRGLVTDAEYESKRREILGGI